MTLDELTGWVLERLARRSYEFSVIITVVVFEIVIRSRHARRMFTSAYAMNIAYCLFYRMGVYALLLERAIWDFLYANLSWQATLAMPGWVRVLGYVLVVDLAQYWFHRWQHSVPWLWALHQVHHSEDQMTMMTVYRVHPLDMWMRNFLSPLVWVIFVGLPPTTWLAVILLWEVILNLSHLEVNWTFGPLRWVFVSPVSHSIHHSIEDRHQSRNLGMALVFWDHLFGTADTSLQRPAAVGLPGWRVRNSLLAHWWEPIRGVYRHYRGLDDGALAPLTPGASTASANVTPGPRSPT